MHLGRAVHYDLSELAALSATLISMPLDFDFPVGTRKKIQPSSARPWPEADLHALTCTCERWQQAGIGAPRGSPSRLCRHLLRFLILKLPPEERGHLEGMIADRSSMMLSAVKEVRIAGRHLCWIGLEEDAPFMSVYARARTKLDHSLPGSGTVRAFRLSKSGDRWGYGEAPYGAGPIKKALAALGVWSPTGDE